MAGSLGEAIQIRTAELEAEGKANESVIAAAEKYKKDLESQATDHAKKVDAEFYSIKNSLNSVQKNFEMGMQNNEKISTNIAIPNLIRTPKNSVLPFVIVAVVLFYFYTKGKL